MSFDSSFVERASSFGRRTVEILFMAKVYYYHFKFLIPCDFSFPFKILDLGKEGNVQKDYIIWIVEKIDNIDNFENAIDPICRLLIKYFIYTRKERQAFLVCNYKRRKRDNSLFFDA